MRDEIIETVRRCLHYAGPLDGTSDITEIVRDSMDLVELVSVVSDRYRVRFDFLEIDNLRTVDDLVAYVETRRGDLPEADPLDRF
jgi:acyl carrier protein